MHILTGLIALALLTACAAAEPVPMDLPGADRAEVRQLAEGQASPPATIDEMAWLAGRWRGSGGLGGISEEVFAPPAAGQMMGMFRQIREDGAPLFYEFYLISEEAGSLVLRIKHFNPDMTGWEDRDESVEFPLVAIEGTAAYFSGLTFERIGDDTLRAAVLVGGDAQVDINYTLVD